MRDLDEQEKSWFLVLENADQLLNLEKPLLATFFSILSDTGKFWDNEGHSFRVALIGGPTLAAAVEEGR